MAPTTDGMAPVKVPANLPELVRSAFNRARASGDVHFFPTEVTLVNVHSVPVRLPPRNARMATRSSRVMPLTAVPTSLLPRARRKTARPAAPGTIHHHPHRRRPHDEG
jgi:ATP adenylyltransferase